MPRRLPVSLVSPRIEVSKEARVDVPRQTRGYLEHVEDQEEDSAKHVEDRGEDHQEDILPCNSGSIGLTKRKDLEHVEDQEKGFGWAWKEEEELCGVRVQP